MTNATKKKSITHLSETELEQYLERIRAWGDGTLVLRPKARRYRLNPAELAAIAKVEAFLNRTRQSGTRRKIKLSVDEKLAIRRMLRSLAGDDRTVPQLIASAISHRAAW